MEGKGTPVRSSPSLTAIFLGVGVLSYSPASYGEPASAGFLATGLPIAPLRIVINIYDPEERRGRLKDRALAMELQQHRIFGKDPADMAGLHDPPLLIPLGDDHFAFSIRGLQPQATHEQDSTPEDAIPAAPAPLIPSRRMSNRLALEFSPRKFKGLSYHFNNDVKITLTGRMKRLLEFSWQMD